MKSAIIVVLLLAARAVTSSVSSSNNRYDKTSVSDSQSSNAVHDVTIDCGDVVVLNKTASECQRDLLQHARYGYPWSPNGSQRNSRHNANATDESDAMKDVLYSLNEVCHAYDRSQTCLEENDIPDYCLATTNQDVSMHIDFQFICHQQERNENLVHSLQCLYDKRLLAMLYFHIADRCSGSMVILDDIMRRYKNALFYTYNIKPLSEPVMHLLSLVCMPREVISTCVRGIAQDHCGTMTAELLQKYLAHYQDWLGQTLKSAGLNSNICDSDITSHMVHRRLPTESHHTKLGISRLLEITAPGTALDTVYGKHALSYVQRLSGKDLCSTNNAYLAYATCVMSADGKSEKSKFNILQFAHQMLPLIDHGTQCSRLEEFTACWNLLQRICGPKIRGLEQHATLLVEGCEIQSELDTVGCHWQDMLIPHYIQASRMTVWPMATQCLQDPINLESPRYSSFNGLMDDLDTVISILQPGVEEISRACGSRPGKRLRSLLNTLHYLQGDAFKYVMQLSEITFPN